MRYEPRQRQLRLTWKVVVFLCFLAVAMGTLIYHLLQTQEVYGAFHACGFSSEEMRNLEKQSSEVIELEDYLFYGESLALYMDPYDGEEDGIYGKTMELVNICSGKQYNFTIGNTADRQIYLPDLEDGTYEIYLIDSFKRKRVVFASALASDAFQTMRRNGKVKEAV